MDDEDAVWLEGNEAVTGGEPDIIDLGADNISADAPTVGYSYDPYNAGYAPAATGEPTMSDATDPSVMGDENMSETDFPTMAGTSAEEEHALFWGAADKAGKTSTEQKGPGFWDNAATDLEKGFGAFIKGFGQSAGQGLGVGLTGGAKNQPAGYGTPGYPGGGGGYPGLFDAPAKKVGTKVGQGAKTIIDEVMSSPYLLAAGVALLAYFLLSKRST